MYQNADFIFLFIFFLAFEICEMSSITQCFLAPGGTFIIWDRMFGTLAVLLKFDLGELFSLQNIASFLVTYQTG